MAKVPSNFHAIGIAVTGSSVEVGNFYKDGDAVRIFRG